MSLYTFMNRKKYLKKLSDHRNYDLLLLENSGLDNNLFIPFTAFTSDKLRFFVGIGETSPAVLIDENAKFICGDKNFVYDRNIYKKFLEMNKNYLLNVFNNKDFLNTEKINGI